MEFNHVFFVLGGPGAGKGTQCLRIVEQFGFVHLSAGELLRQERNSGSSNGELIDTCIREGGIVPVEITATLLRNAMLHFQELGKNHFLVDGFPRNQDNLDGWKAIVSEANVVGVLFFELPESIMEERLSQRGQSSGRKDDNPETIRKRFNTFQTQTMPIVEYYEKLGKVSRIPASGSIDEVWNNTKTVLERIGVLPEAS